MIWGIVLAAGESKRMGQPKLVLPFGRRTVLSSVLQNIRDSGLENILVVLGAGRNLIKKEIGRFPLRTVFNRNYKKGMLSSVQTAFRSLPPGAEAGVVFLGDQPRIPPRVIKSLLRAYRRTGKGLVLPVYRGKRGHPLLIDGKYREEVLSLDSDIGLRQLLWKHPDDVHEVSVSSRSILNDMDTPRDYLRERAWSLRQKR